MLVVSVSTRLVIVTSETDAMLDKASPLNPKVLISFKSSSSLILLVV